MPLITLMYHDVIDGDDWNASGFPGSAAGSYKVSRSRFEDHIQAIRSVVGQRGIAALGVEELRSDRSELLLTFDDGGSSARTVVSPLLMREGWRAYFFVTTESIGQPSFLAIQDIVALHKQGHIIGSHSCTHPARIDWMPMAAIVDEWRRSRDVLSTVLKADVCVASVPGGHFRPKVAEAAASAGVKVLFTSEPTTRRRQMDRCLVLGRYSLRRGMPGRVAANLIQGHAGARWRQASSWRFKRALRSACGPLYAALRDLLLARSGYGVGR